MPHEALFDMKHNVNYALTLENVGLETPIDVWYACVL